MDCSEVLYACPECDTASSVSHWNESTRFNGYWYTCLECGRKITDVVPWEEQEGGGGE